MLIYIIIIISIIALYSLKIYYFNGGVCSSKRRLDGKTVIVTGATAGIGKETARDLARRGAKVIMAVRNLEKAKEVILDIRKSTGNLEVRAMKLDLASLQSVADFAKEYKDTEERLDILVNNAGIVDSEKIHTSDGIQFVFQANYLGHFLLTMLLADMLKKSAPSRVVNVSSVIHKFIKKINLTDLRDNKSKFPISISYAQSKLAQVLATRKLAIHFKGYGVSVFSLHPGYVRTDIFNNIPSCIGTIFWVLHYLVSFYFAKSLKQGTQTSIYCAVQEGIEDLSGSYFSDCKQETLKPHATDDEAVDMLWKTSLEIVSQYYKLV